MKSQPGQSSIEREKESGAFLERTTRTRAITSKDSLSTGTFSY